MKRLLIPVLFFAPACFAAAPVAFAADPTPPRSAKQLAIEVFRQAHPAVSVDVSDVDQVQRILGAPFAHGPDAETTADNFRQTYAPLLGVRSTDLDPRSLLEDGRHAQPLMYDPGTGAYKFTLVYYSQSRDGVPVFRSELRLLVRNEPNFPLVLAASTLKDLGDYSPDGQTVTLDRARLQQIVRQEVAELEKFTEPRRIIWAGYDGVASAPKLSYEIFGESASPASPKGYHRWLFVVDAATGQILYKENWVITETISGFVSGMASDALPPGADICRDENPKGLPYAQVTLSGGVNPVFADSVGFYTITTPGPGPTTIESRIQGQRFMVRDQAAGGAVPILSQSVTPPGPGDFLHNAANTSATSLANVNAYLQANVVRDFIVAANPTYPTIGTQTNFLLNTNISATCNAFYNGTSLNFYQAGGGCANSAFGDVVHHEYGHHVVQTGGSGQGQYGEGLGDILGVLISDQPILGFGFENNCAAGIRTASNTIQYPCGGEIHFCGQLISGCVWETRNLLAVTNPATYRNILADLTVNSVPLHAGSSIAPDITDVFLTLDDDDANLANGTPHCYEINAGFARHGMGHAGFGVTFSYPNGLPDFVPANTRTVVRMDIAGTLCPAPLSGTGKLNYRIGTSGPFTAVNMTEINPNQYEGTLSAASCPAVIQYYFSVDHTSPPGTLTDPPAAPSLIYLVTVAETLVVYNFETTPAWTVSSTAIDGQWDPAPGVPINCSRGDPPTDYDAVGSTKCWLTDNSAASACNSDVDGGATILTSEVFDITALTDPKVQYARWYSNAEGAAPQADIFVIEVSDDGGTTWTSLEVVGPTTGSPNPEVAGGWFLKTFRIEDFVKKTSQFRIRFNASDAGAGSLIEAAIDAFSIFGCPPCPPATGDINGDTFVNGDDIAVFVGALLGTPTFSQTCSGDFNASSALDMGDVDGFVIALLAP